MKMIHKTSKKKIRSKIPKKLKWGIAGCGKYAEETFLPTFQLLKRSKLVSVYSSNLSRAKSISNNFGASNSFDDYDKFLNSDINVVYISSINANHYEQVIKAARAGKHILCEKPLALTSQQAEEMVKVCKDNNVYLTINLTNRFHPHVIKAKELIDKQMLGKIVSVTMSFNIDLPPTDNFRFKKELSGGGALMDLGPHVIDLIRYLGGEMKLIKGSIDNVIYQSEVEDFASALLKFEKNGYGYFHVSYNNPKSFNRIEILGVKGAISIENLIGKRNVSSKLIIDLKGEAKKSFRKRVNKQLRLLRSIQKSFLKNEPPTVTGFDSIISLKLIEEIEKNVSQK